jgi:hypothetical protein
MWWAPPSGMIGTRSLEVNIEAETRLNGVVGQWERDLFFLFPRPRNGTVLVPTENAPNLYPLLLSVLE